MPGHDIVVIGASAGGLEPLRELVHAFPGHMKASVFIVLHTGAESPRLLPTILARSGNLPVQYAANSSTIRPGHVYVAPPDHHMLLRDRKHLEVIHGPKENRARPAIDPLFRSAAWIFGSRVVGIVLSGLLDDGVAGLWAIKEYGGTTIVQDPGEALFPDMPLNALRNVNIDHTLRIEEMARLIPKLAVQPAKKKRRPHPPGRIELENEFAMMRGRMQDMAKLGNPSSFSCPTCHGTMWELHNGQMVRYRCHTGHAFTAESLLAEQSEAVEEALYEALKAMEEKAIVLRRLANRFGNQSPGGKTSYESQAAKQDRNAKIIRELLAKKGT